MLHNPFLFLSPNDPYPSGRYRRSFFTKSKSPIQYSGWAKAIHRFRHKPHRFSSKETNRLKQLFYEKRQTPFSFLPTEVFVPVVKGAVLRVRFLCGRVSLPVYHGSWRETCANSFFSRFTAMQTAHS
ncbi:competence protein CoiA family protein [Bacillus stercoris]|nr:competence protein CoiA family protein [Bacillus stercoris]